MFYRLAPHCFLALLVSCGSDRTNDAAVNFLVPDKFHGLFFIEVSADNANTESPEKKNGFRLVVPDNGLIRISNDSMINNWHKETGMWVSGKKLKVYPYDGPELSEIAIYSLGVVKEEVRGAYYVYCVGDRTLFDSFESNTLHIMAELKKREAAPMNGSKQKEALKGE